MAGVIIDVAAKTGSTSEQLKDINKNLADMVRTSNASGKAFNSIKANNFKSINQNVKETTSGFRNLQKTSTGALQSIDRNTQSASKSINSLKSALIGMGVAYAAYASINYWNQSSDEITKVDNKLKLVEKDFTKLAALQKELYKISTETATPLMNTVDIYYKFSQALAQKNIGKDTILAATKTLQQATVLSGESLESTNAAIRQLGQGISSGTLRGEELNSVLEQMPYLGIAMQKELKMTTGALRKFAEEGKLTSEVVLDVLARIKDTTRLDFSNVAYTSEMAVNRLTQSISLALGKLDKYLAITEHKVNIMLMLSKEIDAMANNTEAPLDSFKTKLKALQMYFGEFDVLSQLSISYDNFKQKLNAFFYDVRRAFRDFSTELAYAFNIDPQTVKKLFTTLNVGFEYFNKLLQAISESYETYIKPVLNKILDFTAKVSEAFAILYDEVIAHSYWTDLMEGIKDKTSFLYLTLQVIDSFVSSVLGFFKSLLDDGAALFRAFFGFLSKAAQKAFSSLYTAFADIGKSIYDVLSNGMAGIGNFFSDFGSMLKKKVQGSKIYQQLIIPLSIEFMRFLEEYKAKISYYMTNFATYIAVAMSGTLGILLIRKFGNETWNRFLNFAFFGSLLTSIGYLFPDFVKGALSVVAKGIGELIHGIIAYMMKAFNGIVNYLPGAFEQLLQGLGVGNFWAQLLVPSNKVIYAALIGLAAYMAFAEKGFKNVSQLLFGEIKHLADGTREIKKQGLTQLLNEIGHGLATEIRGGKPKSPLITPMFLDRRLAILSAGIMTTALFDSISLMDAALAAFPIAIFAAMGRAAGGRMIAQIISNAFVKPFIVAFEQIRSVIIANLGAGGLVGLIAKIFNNKAYVIAIASFITMAMSMATGINMIGVALASAAVGFTAFLGGSVLDEKKSRLSSFFKDTLHDLRLLRYNFRMVEKDAKGKEVWSNSTRYAKGEISLKEAVLNSAPIRTLKEVPDPTDVTGRKKIMQETLTPPVNAHSFVYFDKLIENFAKVKTFAKDAVSAIGSAFMIMVAGIEGLFVGLFKGIMSNLYFVANFVKTGFTGAFGALAGTITMMLATAAGLVYLMGKLLGGTIIPPNQDFGAKQSQEGMQEYIKELNEIETVRRKIGGDSRLTIMAGISATTKKDTLDTLETIKSSGGAIVEELSKVFIGLVSVVTAIKVVRAAWIGVSAAFNAKSLSVGLAEFKNAFLAAFSNAQYTSAVVAQRRNIIDVISGMVTSIAEKMGGLVRVYQVVSTTIIYWFNVAKLAIIAQWTALQAYFVVWGAQAKAVFKGIALGIASILNATPVINIFTRAIGSMFTKMRAAYTTFLATDAMASGGLFSKLFKAVISIKGALIALGVLAVGSTVGYITTLLYGGDFSTFKTNFQWVLDKAKSMSGMGTPSGEKWRREEVAKYSGGFKYGDYMQAPDVTDYANKLNYSGMTNEQFTALLDTMKTSYETLSGAAQKRAVTGFNTFDQREEIAAATKNRQQAILNVGASAGSSLQALDVQNLSVLNEMSLSEKISRLLFGGGAEENRGVIDYNTQDFFIKTKAQVEGTVAALQQFDYATFEWLDNFLSWTIDKTKALGEGISAIWNDTTGWFVKVGKAADKLINIKADFNQRSWREQLEIGSRDYNKYISDVTTADKSHINNLQKAYDSSLSNYKKIARDGYIEFEWRDKGGEAGFIANKLKVIEQLQTRVDDLNLGFFNASQEAKFVFDGRQLGVEIDKVVADLKGKFKFDDDAVASAEVNPQEFSTLQMLSEEYDTLTKRIEKSQTIRERFLRFSERTNIINEAKAIEDIGKKFKTVGGIIEAIGNISTKFTGGVVENLLVNSRFQFAELRKTAVDIKRLEENLQSNLTRPDTSTDRKYPDLAKLSKDFADNKQDFQEQVTYFFDKLKSLPVNSSIPVNELLKSLELQEFTLPISIGLSEESSRTFLLDVYAQLTELAKLKKLSESIFVNPEARFEYLKDYTKGLRETSIALKAYNLQELGNDKSTLTLIDKLDVLKNTFGKELPDEIKKSVTSMEIWATLTRNLAQLELQQEEILNSDSENKAKLYSDVNRQVDILKKKLEVLRVDDPKTALIQNLGKEANLQKSMLRNIDSETAQQINFLLEISKQDFMSAEDIDKNRKLIFQTLIDKVATIETDTVESVYDMFSNLGANLEDVSTMSTDEFDKIKDIYLAVNRLKLGSALKLADGDVKGFFKLNAMANTLVKNFSYMRLRLGEIKNELSGLFELDLNDNFFYTLSSDVQENLKNAVVYFKSNLESLQNTGELLGGASQEAFFEDFTNYKLRVKYLSFLDRLKQDSISIMKGGANDLLSKLTDVFPEITARDIFKMPQGQIRDYVKSISETKTLEDFVYSFNFDDAQLQEIADMYNGGKSVAEIIGHFQDLLPELKPDIIKNIEASLSVATELGKTQGSLEELRKAVDALTRAEVVKLTSTIPEFNGQMLREEIDAVEKRQKAKQPTIQSTLRRDSLESLDTAATNLADINSQINDKTLEIAAIEKLLAKDLPSSLGTASDRSQYQEFLNVQLESAKRNLKLLTEGGTREVIVDGKKTQEEIPSSSAAKGLFEEVKSLTQGAFSEFYNIFENRKEKGSGIVVPKGLSEIEEFLYVLNDVTKNPEAFKRISEAEMEYLKILKKSLATRLQINTKIIDKKLTTGNKTDEAKKQAEQVANAQKLVNIVDRNRAMGVEPTVDEEKAYKDAQAFLAESIQKYFKQQETSRERAIDKTATDLEKENTTKALDTAPETGAWSKFIDWFSDIFSPAVNDIKASSNKLTEVMLPLPASINDLNDDPLKGQATLAKFDALIEMVSRISPFNVDKDETLTTYNSNAVTAATGGEIRGPGSGISDSIHAMLSNGEFVINAKAAEKYGPLLAAINSGKVPKFAEGGGVNSKYFGKVVGDGFEDKYNYYKEMFPQFSPKFWDEPLTGSFDIARFKDFDKIRELRDELRYIFRGIDIDNATPELISLMQEELTAYLREVMRVYSKDLVVENKSIAEGASATAFLNTMSVPQLASGPTTPSANLAVNMHEFGHLMHAATMGLPSFADMLKATKSFEDIKEYYKTIYLNKDHDLRLDNERIASNIAGELNPFDSTNILPLLKMAERTYMGDMHAVDVFEKLLATGKLSGDFNTLEYATAQIGLQKKSLEVFAIEVKALLDRLGSKGEVLSTYDADMFKSSNLQRKANGGKIHGPGSGTSDSIHAMLSNGEFVVNAAAASRNGALLDAINKGYKIPMFSKGTELSAEEVARNKVIVGRGVQELVISLKLPEEAYSWIMRMIEKESNFNPEAKNPKSSASGLWQVTRATAEGLNTTAEAIRSMSLEDQLGTFAEELFKYQAKQAKKQPSDMKTPGDLYTLWMSPANFGKGKDTKLFEKGTEEYSKNRPYDLGDKGYITVGDLDSVISSKGYVKSDEKKDSGSTSGRDAVSRIFDYDASFGKLLKSLEEQKAGRPITKTDLETLNNLMGNSKIGMRMTPEQLFGLSPQDYAEITKSAIKYNDALVALNKATTPEEAYAATQSIKKLNNELKRIPELMEYVQKSGKSLSDTTINTLEGTVKELFTNNDIEDYGEFFRGKLDNLTDSVISTFIEGIFEPFKRKEGGMLDTMSSGISGLGVSVGNMLSGESEIGQSLKTFFGGNGESTTPVNTAASGAAAATSAIAGSMSNMCQCMQGVLGGGGGGGIGFNLSATNGALGSPEDGGESALLAAHEAGAFSDAMSETASSTKAATENVSTSFGSMFTQIGSAVGGTVGTVISGIGSILSALSGLGGKSGGGNFDWLSALFSVGSAAAGAPGGFGFATGGMISGPGSGISDSIPAMLSNGEFVVNAKATARNVKLLTAINTGKLAKFADGGLVGATPIDAEQAYAGGSGGNQQVINIGITGDISRQTKAEIYRMLPDIASGVNYVNKSRGHRG